MTPDPAALALLLPLAAAALLALLRAPALAGWISLAATALTCLLVATLPWQPPSTLFLLDPLAAHIALLIALTALAAAWIARADAPAPRLHYPFFQLLLAALLLTVLADDLVLAWLGLATAIAAGLPRTPLCLAAAWRLLLLSAASLGLVLFGIVLLRIAAPSALDLRWSVLLAAAAQCRAGWLSLAFACLLPGLAAAAALAPLQSAATTAQTHGPLGLSGLLGAALTPTALLLLLRARDLLAGNAASFPPGPPLLALGLLTLLLAALLLPRQSNLRALLVTACLAQTGLVAFAFGLGGPEARAAGLFLLTGLVLARIAAFCWLALPPDLAASRPARLTLAATLVALAGLPPFGLFPGLFLLVTATLHTQPWLILPLAPGLIATATTLTARLFAPADAAPTAHASLLPLAPSWIALAALLLAGLGLPAPLAPWFASLLR